MRVLKRRLRQGTLRERVFRLTPVTEQPDPDIEIVSWAPPVMAERRPDPVAEYAKAYAPGTKMEELLQFPTADPVEDEIFYVPTKFEMDTARSMNDDDVPAQLLYMTKCWDEQVTCVQLLENMAWLDQVPDTAENETALRTIFENGMLYCHKFSEEVLLPWRVSKWPLNPRLWLAETERVLQLLEAQEWLPYWLENPHTSHLRQSSPSRVDGWTSPGEFGLDTLVHALRLWQYCKTCKTRLTDKRSSIDSCHNANRSSVSPVHLKGKIVEDMMKNLQQAGSTTPAYREGFNPYEFYWTMAAMQEKRHIDEPETKRRKS